MFRQQQVLAKYGLGEMKFRDPAAGSGTATPKQEDPKAVVTSDMTGTVKL